jgi:hypothetical protein
MHNSVVCNMSIDLHTTFPLLMGIRLVVDKPKVVGQLIKPIGTVKPNPKPRAEINEHLLHSLVTIERLLLESIRVLENSPFREELFVKGQISEYEQELKLIQGEINCIVFGYRR